MNSTPRDPEVIIGIDGTYRRVPLVAIAALVRQSHETLRDSFSKLFFALLDRGAESLSFPEREPQEGENGSVPGGNGTVETVPEYKENGSVPDGTVEPSDAPAPSVTASAERTLSGAFLAELLDDPTSLPFYDTLVATVDHRHITHALDETLRRRAALRGRPGGYFTAVVRRLTHSQRPYV